MLGVVWCFLCVWWLMFGFVMEIEVWLMLIDECCCVDVLLVLINVWMFVCLFWCVVKFGVVMCDVFGGFLCVFV